MSKKNRNRNPGKRPSERILKDIGKDLKQEDHGTHVRRMKTIYVPCPHCKTFLEVMAYDIEGPQEVMLPQHSIDPADRESICDFFGEYSLPASNPRSVFLDQADDFLNDPIKPSERRFHPEAISEDRPLLDRMTDYFMGCPFSTLLKCRQEIRASYEMLANLASIFGMDRGLGPDGDPFTDRINDFFEVIENSFKVRMAEGLRRVNTDYIDDTIEFREANGLEFIHIPLSAIVTTAMKASRIKPGGSPADSIRPFDPRED